MPIWAGAIGSSERPDIHEVRYIRAIENLWSMTGRSKSGGIRRACVDLPEAGNPDTTTTKDRGLDHVVSGLEWTIPT